MIEGRFFSRNFLTSALRKALQTEIHLPEYSIVKTSLREVRVNINNMVTEAAPQQDTRSLWLGLLTGPLTWAVYFILGYLLVEAVCKTDFLSFSLFGLTALSAIILLLTVLGLFITLYACFFNYRKWQQALEKGSQDFDDQLGHRPARFMALAGLLLGGLFTLIILLTGASVFILRPC